MTSLLSVEHDILEQMEHPLADEVPSLSVSKGFLINNYNQS